MRALYFAEHGDTSKLQVGELPDPRPGAGEVVVAVRAAALNHLDLFVLRGLPGIEQALPHIGGADGAGVVAVVGEGVADHREGDEVVLNPGLWCGECEYCRRGEESMCVRYGLLGEHAAGTFASYVKVPAVCLGPKPGALSWEEAAAFPLTFLTAWRMLVTRGNVRAGETVLVHGIGGGVALAALAIAKRLGAAVIVTSSDDRKLERATAMGADWALNYREVDVVREVRSLTGRRGVDLVLETVGEGTWMTSLRCAAKGGRIVTCGATSGPNPTEEVRLVFWNQLTIVGSTMGSRGDWKRMLEAVDEWGLRPVIDSVHTLDRGRDAYERLASGRQLGKVVLTVE